MNEQAPRPSRKLADEALLTALACGATVEVAAQRAGISTRTAYRRLGDPAFKKRIAEIQGETIARCSAILTAACLEATKALLELVRSAKSEAVRGAVARTILDFSMRIREHKDIEDRLAALEKRSGIA